MGVAAGRDGAEQELQPESATKGSPTTTPPDEYDGHVGHDEHGEQVSGV